MFIGHFAVGLAAKRAAPQVSLGAWFFAAQWADLLWPLMVLLGWERVSVDPGNTAVTPLAFESYPISHSLLALAGWGVLIGGGASGWLGAVVVSHWVLDWISHRPDLPLAPGLEMKVGLGLWNSLAATLLVEGAMFAAGIWLYLRARPDLQGKARWGFWGLIGLLLVIYLSAVLGPPPPSAAMASGSAFGLWLFVLWGWAVDRPAASAR